MKTKIYKLDKRIWPRGLSEIYLPPKELKMLGEPPPKQNINLCVIGSRKNTEYGENVCRYLIDGLRGYPVSIISGLAYGIDRIAHEAALKTGLYTAAVIGSGLKEIYPRKHLPLVEDIVLSKGGIISEYSDNTKPSKLTFPERNRIMVGISQAILVIEAKELSGTLITARIALQENRDVFAVPGDIHSESSIGPNTLIKTGATPITSPKDLIQALGFD